MRQLIEKNGYPLEVSYVDTFWFDKLEIPPSSLILCSPESPILPLTPENKNLYKIIVSDNPRLESEKMVNNLGYDLIPGIGNPVPLRSSADFKKLKIILNNPDSDHCRKQFAKAFPKRFHGYRTDIHHESSIRNLEAASERILTNIRQWERSKEIKLSPIIENFLRLLYILEGIDSKYESEIIGKIKLKYSEKVVAPFFKFMFNDEISQFIKKVKSNNIAEAEFRELGCEDDDFKKYRGYFDKDNDNAIIKIQQDLLDTLGKIQGFILNRPDLFQFVPQEDLAKFESLI